MNSLPTQLEHDEPATLPPGYRPAAVVALLHGEPADPALLFTLRQAHLPDHGGQISFPGGALEPGEDYWQAAVRECIEEVGIDARDGHLLGRLTELAIPTSRFLVVPFVVHRAEPIASHQVHSAAEVALAFSHRLRELGGWRRTEEAGAGGRGPGPWPVFDLPEGRLWGASAIMTDQLLTHWQASEEPLA